MTIERYEDEPPKCRECGKPLRPNYATEREGLGEATGTKRVYLSDDEARYHDLGMPDDPSIITTTPAHVGGDFMWEPREQAWYRMEKVYRTKERRFLGTFGREGSNLFCTLRCGFRYACRMSGED